MTRFKAADELIAEHDVKGVPRRRPEIQDQSFWREKVVAAVDQAKKGEIFGLMSWDPDLRNSLSADPVKDPFALDRQRYPIGPGGRLPRQIAYYLPPTQIPGAPAGTMTPWRLVVLEAQLLDEDLLPQKLAVGAGGRPIEAEPSVRRAPDDLRAEIWLDDDVAKELQKANFRVLPIPADELFSRRGQTRAVTEAFQNVPVLSDGISKSHRVIYTTTDWNLPLAATQGGATASHILKGRNTHVSAFIGQMKRLGVTFIDGSKALFRHREIFVPYESIVTLVTVEPDPTDPRPDTRRAEYSDTLRKDPTTNAPPDVLARVKATQTHFTAPATFVTLEVEGEFKKGNVGFNVTGQKMVLPPSARQIDVVKADGTRAPLTYNPRQGLAALITDLQAILDSLASALPAEIRKRLPPVK